MNRILITGACGSIGSALTKKLLSEDKIVCALDNSEDGLFKLKRDIKNNHYSNNLKTFLGDVRDIKRLTQAMKNIDLVFHCAALKHVELSEYNPSEALETNVNGTNNVIEAALTAGVQRVIVTSSDKAVNPSSMMGVTKLLSEKLAINANNIAGSDDIKISCVRFGNVWNTNGSVGPIFKNQILKGENLTLTSPDMTRFFISIKDAIDLCIKADEEMVGGEIFISDMGAASIGDLAKEFQKLNKTIEINEIGLKAGEKLYEELFTDVESFRTYSFDDMYVILPDSFDKYSSRNTKLEKKYKRKTPIKIALRSDSHISKNIDLQDLVKDLMDES
jgi:FlaA1/EpsC-like NDP-sugar epimerase